MPIEALRDATEELHKTRLAVEKLTGQVRRSRRWTRVALVALLFVALGYVDQRSTTACLKAWAVRQANRSNALDRPTLDRNLAFDHLVADLFAKADEATLRDDASRVQTANAAYALAAAQYPVPPAPLNCGTWLR
jgi:hypothetical protein